MYERFFSLFIFYLSFFLLPVASAFGIEGCQQWPSLLGGGFVVT